VTGRKRTPKARPLDESLDNIGRFFENVAKAVVRDGGIFIDDALTSRECAMIATHCAKISAEVEGQAATLRARLIRRAEGEED
jgi:hypothetical protein